jgi:hypothetical protein
MVIYLFLKKAAFSVLPAINTATAYRDPKRPQAWHKVNRAARRLSTPPVHHSTWDCSNPLFCPFCFQLPCQVAAILYYLRIP